MLAHGAEPGTRRGTGRAGSQPTPPSQRAATRRACQQPGGQGGHRQDRLQARRTRRALYAQRAAQAVRAAEAAAVPDHDHRLLPADGGNPPGAQPVQGAASSTRPATRQPCKREIARSVREQEALGLDVLVHGEAERNDMVEYFGEQLDGYAFSQFGWVQSYGSRCVKPPILFGDISRPKADDGRVDRVRAIADRQADEGHADRPGHDSAMVLRARRPAALGDRATRLALAIRDEVLDLEKAGVRVIQIDEAALREGLPLRKSQWKAYLDWAVECVPHHRQRRGGRDADPHPHVLFGVQRHHRVDRRHGRRRDHHRDLALGHGAARRLRRLQLPERDRPGRLRHPLAQHPEPGAHRAS